MSRIIGIGIDVVEVDRIAKSVERWGDRFRRKVFTDGEWEYCMGRPRVWEHLAGRFAAKEAVLKALGTGWNASTSFHEIEVVRSRGQAPTVVLSPRIRGLLPDGDVHVWLSISHTHRYAVAQAVISLEDST